jgi:hypothetical protein
MLWRIDFGYGEHVADQELWFLLLLRIRPYIAGSGRDKNPTVKLGLSLTTGHSHIMVKSKTH